MCTGSYTEVHPQKPKLEGNKTVALYYQGVFFRKKKIECTGDAGKKERTLAIVPCGLPLCLCGVGE